MARSTFKYAIGSTVYAIHTRCNENSIPNINIRECKIKSTTIDNTKTSYHIVDSKGILGEFPEKELFPDKESVYKEIDRIFNI